MSARKVMALLSGLGLAALVAPDAAQARYPWEFPTPVTPVAKETLWVHNIFLTFISIVFVVVLSIMLYSLFFHRKSRGAKAASFTAPRTKLQFALSTIPFLILAFVDYVVMGIPAYHAVLAMANTRAGSQMVVKVTGMQWKWQYEYPGLHIKYLSTITTPQAQIHDQAPKNKHFLRQVNHPLVLPVNEKIRVILASKDVIHSWWVPAFGVKEDSIPGFLRETWVKIDKPGVYRGQCAELCGVGHAFMPVVVDAVSDDQFKQWVAKEQAREQAAKAQQAAATAVTYTEAQLVTMGQKVFTANCAACHQASGMGIPGTFPPIAAGHAFSAAPNMIAQLRKRGFITPGGKIVEGPVASHINIVLQGIAGTPMPPFGASLSNLDIASVITFERNSFGNHTGDIVQPAQVQAARAANQKP
ncbi:MAG: cytochrome c oxidase subunit II [Acidiferrobacterales bacterium]